MLRSLLTGVSDDWIYNNEGGQSWSPIDIVGHLICGEQTDWIIRTGIILEHGEEKTFEPFDRFAQFEQSEGVGLEELLDTFEDLRRRNLEKLEELCITEDQMRLRGTHPDLGSVTLEQLLATWTAHDLGHIAQIARVMAKQYSEAVGPWRQYLPVLDRK